MFKKKKPVEIPDEEIETEEGEIKQVAKKVPEEPQFITSDIVMMNELAEIRRILGEILKKQEE